jgi:PAS domain S-box-containing protein
VVHVEPTPRNDLSELNKGDESDGYKHLLRFVSDAVLEIEPDLSITFANRAGLELFGITDDECGNGLNLTELLDQSCLRPLFMHLANALAEKHQAPTVARFMPRNGTRFEGELSISILDNGEDSKRIWAVVKNLSRHGEKELPVGISESRHN